MIYLQLFRSFFFIGCFSFGGGYAMLPLIDHQVTTQGWMTPEQFTEIIAVSGMLPGSIGTNAAVFVGYQTGGIIGASAAALGMVLPSLIIIILIGKLIKHFQSNETIAQAFYGLRPVIVGIIIYSAVKFSFSMNIVTALSLRTVSFTMIFLLSLFLIVYKNVHPILIIILSGICGVILYY